jgi:hypothetical protein
MHAVTNHKKKHPLLQAKLKSLRFTGSLNLPLIKLCSLSETKLKTNAKWYLTHK